LKETNFFIEEGNWSNGIEWYHDLFAPATPGQLVGEASPAYTMFPTFAGAPRRMAQHIPEAKLVYLMREPVTRMISGWEHLRADYMDRRPLNQALLADLVYVAPSQYALQIEQFLAYYDRSALLVVRTEDLAANPLATMTKVCVHLGLDPAQLGPLGERHNPSDIKTFPRRHMVLGKMALERVGRPQAATWLRAQSRGRWTHRAVTPTETVLSPEVRAVMTSYIAPDMARLRQIVGPDLDLWGHA